MHQLGDIPWPVFDQAYKDGSLDTGIKYELISLARYPTGWKYITHPDGIDKDWIDTPIGPGPNWFKSRNQALDYAAQNGYVVFRAIEKVALPAEAEKYRRHGKALRNLIKKLGY